MTQPQRRRRLKVSVRLYDEKWNTIACDCHVEEIKGALGKEQRFCVLWETNELIERLLRNGD